MADPILTEWRASDAERERVAGTLREHGAAGRLDVEELEERLGLAYAARTGGDLEALSADLPPLQPPRAPARPPLARTFEVSSELAGRVAGWVGLAVLLVAIWALTGAGYFWPVWPIMGTAFGVMFGGPKHMHGGCGSHTGRRARPQRD